MFDIAREIYEKYNLDVLSFSSFRDYYRINTTIGKKFLKKVLVSNERLLFIHEAKEYLYTNGFIYLDRYCYTVDKSIYVNLYGSDYTLNNAFEGRECNFENKKDILGATKALAQFHKSSKGFGTSNVNIKNKLGLIPKVFEKRLEEFKKIKKVSQNGKTLFDQVVCLNIDLFYKMGKMARELINCSKYYDIVENSKCNGILCHNNLTHDNIVINDNVVSLINFDKCNFDIKVYDLANLIRRRMRKCNWDISEASCIIEQYNEIEEISSDEVEVLKAILLFPQKFWRIVNKYYNSKRGCTEKYYLQKLTEIINEKKYINDFFEQFDDIFCNYLK